MVVVVVAVAVVVVVEALALFDSVDVLIDVSRFLVVPVETRKPPAASGIHVT